MTLGRSEDDYLSATPRMLVAALERYREQRDAQHKMSDQRAGIIAAAIYTGMGVQPKSGGNKVWRPRDFFPSLAPVRAALQSAAEMEAAIVATNKALGGRDLRQRTH